MLNRAGMDTSRENSRVRIPLADLTKRSTRPTLKTLITRSTVGDRFRYCSIMSLNDRPKTNTYY